ncbi:hypothetical protein NDU88_007622 [Pleurodeles waltl]|uniref:Uncharacterized protein n=1 Tax=Pleurodeles waltl TaxID=8319 RepID=A0AAV7VSU3_PLEWA|nr:hypothetical protein NDU88_007622 [Pleurodeles waltl]
MWSANGGAVKASAAGGRGVRGCPARSEGHDAASESCAAGPASGAAGPLEILAGRWPRGIETIGSRGADRLLAGRDKLQILLLSALIISRVPLLALPVAWLEWSGIRTARDV